MGPILPLLSIFGILGHSFGGSFGVQVSMYTLYLGILGAVIWGFFGGPGST